MALENYPTTPPDVCWTVEGYSGKQDFAELFLGDRYIPVKAEASLSALFTTNASLTSFLTWWEEDTNEGTLPFIIGDITIFGKRSAYVVKQISEFKHNHLYKTLSFDVQIDYDSNSVSNIAPTTQDVTLSVEKNTQNNYILLDGQDAEGDVLTFEINSQPLFGILTGVPPTLAYTPNTDYEGTDSFTYTASDIFNESNISTVTIGVGIGELTDAQFNYNVTDDVYVSGNYHYDNGSGNIARGTDEILELERNVIPPTTFVSRATTATYVDAGVLGYAIADIERFEDGVKLFEQESTNYLLYSNNMTNAWWTLTRATKVGGISAPDGSTDAVKVTADIFTNDNAYIKTATAPLNGAGVVDGSTVVASTFVKKGTTQYCSLTLISRETSTEAIFFDFDNKIFTTINSGVIGYGFSELSNGWIRLWFSTSIENDIAGPYDGQLRIFMCESPTTNKFDSDGTDYIYTWGAQLEVKDSPTSLIVTTTVPVTRAMDKVTSPTFSSRASTATYISGGKLYYAIADEARVQDRVLLLEDESENIQIQSATPSITYAEIHLNAVTTDGTKAPDGIIDAEFFVPDATLNAHYLNDNSVSAFSDIEQTFSIFIKPSGVYETITMSVYGSNTSNLLSITFRLDEQTYNTSVGGESILNDVNLLAIGNGWYRCSVTFTSLFDATTTKPRLILSADGTATNYSGVIGEGLYVWGAMFEEGELSSYIPTTTTVETRETDLAQYPIKIWSNDHKVITNENITTLKVMNWGDRLSYEDFLNGYPNITSFTIDGAAGVCQGMIFTRMFKDFPTFVRLFDTSQGIYFASMFEGCQSAGIPAYDFSSGLYFQKMLKGSAVKNTQQMNTLKGQYFQEFFMDSDIECVGGIHTGSAINTLKMFDNTTSLTNPATGAAQTSILAGAGNTNGSFDDVAGSGILAPWVSANPCIMVVDGITEISNTPATIAVVDGTATATATYEVIFSDETLPMTFVWTVTGADIVSGEGTATVVLENVIGSDTEFTISCAVTDSVGTIDTGDFLFTYTVDYTYLILNLPVQYDLLNLETYIDANNPLVKTEVLVKNTITNAPIESGDLTGINVKLVNTGHLQGYNTVGDSDAVDIRNNGLSVTTAFVLDNSSGTISGCGGHGGLGGTGTDTTNPLVTTYVEYTSGTSTFVVPAHVTSIELCMIGGGGSGYGQAWGVENAKLGGGYAGTIVTQTVAVTPNDSITVTAGAGGPRRDAGSNNGSASFFGAISAAGGTKANNSGGYGGNNGLRTTCGGSHRDGTLVYYSPHNAYAYGGQAGFGRGGTSSTTLSTASGLRGSGGAGGWDTPDRSGSGGAGVVGITYVTYLVGGDGGAGGEGAGYNEHAIGQDGDAGNLSTPTGGNSGGAGGDGGNFGTDGLVGLDGEGGGTAGAVGKTAGKAITGSSLLKVGSTTGTTNGIIT